MPKNKRGEKLISQKSGSERGAVVIYKAKDGRARLDVKLEKETVWLTQKQIADLFGAERSVITKHLKNIFQVGELAEKSNVQKMHITLSDKPVSFYNLDVIISVGYRVNSHGATQFRIWATKTLKEHLIKGYTLNQKRLAEQASRLQELRKAVSLIQEKSRSLMLQDQAQELLGIISDYAQSLSLLHQYDEGKLELKRTKKPRFVLTYMDSQRLIRELKRKVLIRREASDLFGVETGERFKAVIGSLYQIFDGKELYQSLEEKAANLLYLTIKDHPFIDGNKRIASILFVYFLECNNYLRRENGERKINDNALVTLALLIAVSHPKEKDIIVKMTTNLLKD